MGGVEWSAIITGTLTLAGVIVTNIMANRKIEQALVVAQAVTDTKIDNLTAEVREHNNFAKRMPVVESEIADIKRRITAIEGRVYNN